MATLIPEDYETVAPSEADAVLARESSRRLAAYELGTRDSVRVQLFDGGEKAETLAVPASALRLFLHLLDDEARARILDQLTAEAQELGMGY